MSEELIRQLVERLKQTHSFLLEVSQNVAEDQFARPPGESSPPIGWHLWHVARWADRLQASLPGGLPEGRKTPDPNQGIWETDSLAAAWGLEASALGILQTGSGIAHEDARRIAAIGQGPHLEYAHRAFRALEAVIANMDSSALDQPRESIEQFVVEAGHHHPGAGIRTTAAGDLALYIQHSNRHLGMIEAIRGGYGMKGTATN